MSPEYRIEAGVEGAIRSIARVKNKIASEVREQGFKSVAHIQYEDGSHVLSTIVDVPSADFMEPYFTVHDVVFDSEDLRVTSFSAQQTSELDSSEPGIVLLGLDHVSA